MGRVARITLMYLATFRSCIAVPGAPIAVFPINEGSIAQMRKQHPLVSAEVDDPVYKRKQRYQGFWLRDILKKLGQGSHSEADLYVQFRCKDGYLAVMPLGRAMGRKGLIAIRDANAPQGENWQPLPESGTASALAPSYLVWLSPRGEVEEYPWPYGIVAIELVSSSDVLDGLNADGPKAAGHALFVRHCVKCHAINGVGGTFGPELNAPCSVTEYWNPRLLSRFIANPGSVRAATRMPNFDALPSTDIQSIVEYLQSMAAHKKPGATCP